MVRPNCLEIRQTHDCVPSDACLGPHLCLLCSVAWLLGCHLLLPSRSSIPCSCPARQKQDTLPRSILVDNSCTSLAPLCALSSSCSFASCSRKRTSYCEFSLVRVSDIVKRFTVVLRALKSSRHFVIVQLFYHFRFSAAIFLSLAHSAILKPFDILT
ncbi:hypothetical protein LMH87_010259 [Akanthomyces muscarius]|uniref:Uncharacterized protein n=1 Tax=Akanthomyces muscarius TaxID=2231603 RepID=A0A9W8QEL4_AKAMU|nr:hypothetical protein LMH87_010259 [Akanthomyces muscarius]KAJ4153787.1 hypothetical protein LMH87_010259 [Akanthomyces muscarius]